MDSLQLVSLARIAMVEQEFPGVPVDFIDFLQEIGAGTLGRQSYRLYDGLVSVEEIHGSVEDGLGNLALFGDDLQGFNDGFDTRSWAVVEIDPTNMTLRQVASSFEEFIRAKIAELS